MRSRILTPVTALLPLIALACGSGAPEWNGQDDADDPELGSSSEAVAACEGDDLQYDFNAFAASLAVATAKELGRWDVGTDFEVRSGKLELSSTGELHCGTGCSNIRALLRLQDDTASGVPYHSPSVYRSKLTTWHQREKQQLTALVDTMLTVDKGIYRLRNRQSNKYMAVDGGSTSDWAGIEQKSTVAVAGADQWRIVLDHGKHKFINVRSGKCLALSSDSSADNTGFIQLTCSGSDLQRFEFAEVTTDYYAISTKYLRSLRVKDGSGAEDAPLVEYQWQLSQPSLHWKLEPIGGGADAHSPNRIANAVYSLKVRHSGKSLAVDNGSVADGAAIEQATYVPSDDRFHWYIVRTGDKQQYVNRRSGKCLALQQDNPTSRLVQRTCNGSAGQLFYTSPTGDGTHVIFGSQGSALAIEGASLNNDAPLGQGPGTWDHNKQFYLTPIVAGEPHRLSFSHSTDDGPCGDYSWFNITQPNGQPLRSPADSFVQLIFAGGKTSLTGKDENPFIAQQVSGNQVAIDPSGYMNGASSSTSGSCIDSDILFDGSRQATGKCCVRYNGVIGSLRQSIWSTTTFLCL